MRKLIGKNTVRLDLPDQLKIHIVLHVVHITLFLEQPFDIAQALLSVPDPVPVQDEE